MAKVKQGKINISDSVSLTFLNDLNRENGIY
jgi:hypothetical protein